MDDASVRPQVARWVVREVTAPNERAVAVAVVLRVENLSPPGEEDTARRQIGHEGLVPRSAGGPAMTESERPG